ncbi:type III secretion system needle length determinant, SpaN/EivJ family [Chromobacterium violaceum]|uniref:Surface presentation of antigen domain-containing protein n=1 Tax=Chromobacterium violaceum TaxID=536 RepID=A0A202B7B2_CHRVL|nr:type III secretion system needle length determinant, SpaN/EivJ family [Chromobacterium violaceum]OVE47220.1 hypothetical protein CBW21_14740 [Chromobacterium violaceum]
MEGVKTVMVAMAPATEQSGDGMGLEEAFEREASSLERERQNDDSELGAEPSALAERWQPPLPLDWRQKRDAPREAQPRRAASVEQDASPRAHVAGAAGKRLSEDGKAGARWGGKTQLSPFALPAWREAFAPQAIGGEGGEARLKAVDGAAARLKEEAMPLAGGDAGTVSPQTETLLQEHVREAAPASNDAPPAKKAREGETKPAAMPAPGMAPQAAQHQAHLPAQAAQPAAPRSRADWKQALAAGAATPAQAQETGAVLTYRFQRWGGEHAVSVQALGHAGATQLSLTPSDGLVQQRLAEQWQSGNPQQWTLRDDGGQGSGGRQPQRDEEEEG